MGRFATHDNVCEGDARVLDLNLLGHGAFAP